MKIEINPDNEAAIEAALDKANGAFVQPVVGLTDIYDMVSRAEAELDQYGIPRSEWTGAKKIKYYAPITRRPYKGVKVTIEFVKTWHLAGVELVDARRDDRLILTRGQKKTILNAMLARIKKAEGNN